MKFRLVKIDNKGNIIKIYYCSPIFFKKEDFDELKKKYISELNINNISSKDKFEIQETKDNVLWKYYSNPILV